MKIKHTLYIILLTASLIPLYIFASVMIVQNNKNTKSMMQENLRFISESTISSIESFCEARRDTIDMITQYEMIQDAVHSSLDGSISDDDSISYIIICYGSEKPIVIFYRVFSLLIPILTLLHPVKILLLQLQIILPMLIQTL